MGNDSKQVTTGDIIEIPKGAPYKFTSTEEEPVRFAAVRSNAYLEDLIDNQVQKLYHKLLLMQYYWGPIHVMRGPAFSMIDAHLTVHDVKLLVLLN